MFTEVSNLVFDAQSTVPVISGRNVDRNTYCQPVEVVQKAKVASVLLQVNAGVKVDDACHGSLEEETITQGSDGGGDSDSDSEYHGLPPSSPHHNNKVSPSTSYSENRVTSSQSCPKAKSKNSQVKRPWSGEEPVAVQCHLASCLILNPKKHACESFVCRASSPKENVERRKVLCLQLAKEANRKLPFIGVDRKFASKLDSRLTDVCSWH